jgi:transcriptional regulator with XRE-family HTH domain
MSTALREAANDYVAEELRAEMGRKRISMSELARRMDVEHTWLYKRLTGTIPLRFGEVFEIANLLDLPLDQIGWDSIKRRLSHLRSDLHFRALAIAF